jgi:hypothetical protein
VDRRLVNRSCGRLPALKTWSGVVRVAAVFAIVNLSALVLIAVLEEPVANRAGVIVLALPLFVKLETHLFQNFANIGLGPAFRSKVVDRGHKVTRNAVGVSAEAEASLALPSALVVLQVDNFPARKRGTETDTWISAGTFRNIVFCIMNSWFSSISEMEREDREEEMRRYLY